MARDTFEHHITGECILSTNLSFLATCPVGLGSVLTAELSEFGASDVRETPAGVHFSGSLALAYRACLWSRLANRILLRISDTAVASADDVYNSTRSVRWSEHLSVATRFSVEFRGQTNYIKNTHFGALKVKDGIVDFFRDREGARPSVDPKRPDLRIVAQLSKGRLTLSLDLSGESLHRRGYRLEGGKAPLKENVAAAVLIRAGWAKIAEKGGSLIDPMCGSGTLLIEAAQMAMSIAPGLARQRFGFHGWLGHNEDQWRAIRSDAESKKRDALPANVEIRGYDGDVSAIRKAEENIKRMGMASEVRVRARQLSDVAKPTHREMLEGLIVVNPPWGERLSNDEAVKKLYAALGRVLYTEFSGWQAAVLAADTQHARSTGLRSHKNYKFKSGPLDIGLYLFDLAPDNELRSAVGGERKTAPDNQGLPELSDGAQMFANRLRKNLKRLQKWRQQSGVECFRLYDADMPEYAVAIDIYGKHLHIAEYAAPKSVNEADATRRFNEVVEACQVVFTIPDREEIGVKRRERQRGARQYERVSQRGERHQISELGARLWVNLHDYLDTGIFLDHRPIRRQIQSEVRGKRFLNLFAYTGVASVQAALGGARFTTSVDLSNTYLDWFRDNLASNGLAESRNRAIKSDVIKWLSSDEGLYDVILLDPPTFSNSKSTEKHFDVQRDQTVLISSAMGRLEKNGTLYFSNNHRKFELDSEVVARFIVEEITASTIDPDFERSQGIHRCWAIRHKA